jgi:hypothetical protein
MVTDKSKIMKNKIASRKVTVAFRVIFSLRLCDFA